MNKSIEGVREAGSARPGWRDALDPVILHKWTMPLSGMAAAVFAAVLAGQVVAWKFDAKTLPVLPEISVPPEPAPPSAIRMSSGGFVPQAPVVRPAAASSSAVAKSGLPVELLGTFVHASKKPAKSLAIVQLTSGTREAKVLRIGEKWQSMELLNVDRGRILVQNLSSGAREYISNDQLVATTVDVTSRSAAGVPVKPAAVDASSSDEILLSRDQVNRAMNYNSSVIFSWVDVQPHAVAGKVEGFRLNNIKPRGKPFFDLLKFREGDIVKRVNGVKMDSVDKAVGLWGAIHGKDKVTFTIERQGVDKEITLVFKE